MLCSAAWRCGLLAAVLILVSRRMPFGAALAALTSPHTHVNRSIPCTDPTPTPPLLPPERLLPRASGAEAPSCGGDRCAASDADCAWPYHSEERGCPQHT